jgi:hypothetical protein
MLLRLAYGSMLVAVLFVPFGVYHSTVEPYVTGYLWGFLLLVGYVAAASGITVILYPRLPALKKLRFDTLLLLIGLALLFFVLVIPREFAVNLFNGTSFSPGQVDIDYAVGNAVVLFLAILSGITGVLIRMNSRLASR